MIQLCGVHLTHRGSGSRPVLRGVDLRVESGAAVLLSGPTGAGKSTLLQLVYAGIQPDAGTVEVFGRCIARLRSSSIAILRRHVGVVPQTLELMEYRSVYDNVALPLEVRADPGRVVRERVSNTLKELGLADHQRVLVSALSMGQRQLCAIGRALVGGPDALIADEPTAHLDNPARERVIERFEAARERGCTLLVASNDHKLLRAGARLGWGHVELDGGVVRMIADRTPSAHTGTDKDENRPDLHPGQRDEEDPDKTPSLLIDDNVLPFPLVVHAGGLVE